MQSVVSVLAVVAVSVVLGACAGAARDVPSAPGTVVAIADLKSVAGRWEGLCQGSSTGSVLGGHSADWLELTINADGTYEARSCREIGVMSDKGTLTLSDNALHYASPRSRGVMYLVDEPDGKRVLRLRGRLGSGAPVSAELTPAKK
jgi:hypothetical protein